MTPFPRSRVHSEMRRPAVVRHGSRLHAWAPSFTVRGRQKYRRHDRFVPRRFPSEHLMPSCRLLALHSTRRLVMWAFSVGGDHPSLIASRNRLSQTMGWKLHHIITALIICRMIPHDAE